MLSPKHETDYTIHWNSIFQIKRREKYILVPQTTTISPDGLPNYQCLDSGPPNYHFLIFWPHRPFMPSILNRIPKIPLLHFEILTVKGRVFSGFWPISVIINGINRRIGPKNQKVVVWGVGVQVLVVRGAIRRKGGSLGG
jgi:hypothetical protein